MFKKLLTAVKSVFGATSSASNPDRWFIDWLRDGLESDSGVPITTATAIGYAPAFYSLQKIAGNLGMLPTILYQRRGERRKLRAKDHPAYSLIKKRPNAMMSAQQFKETLQLHATLHGNGRAAIVRDERTNAPLELVPLLPHLTRTVLVNGEKWHVGSVVVDTGANRMASFRLPDRDVIHISGLSYDGIVGYSLLEVARHSLGLGLAAERHGNRLFKNNAVPGLILQAPAGVFKNDEEAKKFLAAFRAMHEGLDNTSKTALLREGVTAQPLSVNGRDSQWIEQRQFQRQEAALWFAIESILGDDKSVSYNSQEQKQLAYLVNCLTRWITKWEQELDDKLLTGKQKISDSHFFKFNTGALLRADTKTTIETLGVAITHRIMNPNEARDLLDLDEYDGGDEYANPNITTGPAKQTSSTARAKLEQVIGDRLLEAQRVERKRVADAAAKADFGSWCERFYSAADWLATVERTVVGCGGRPEMAAEYCAGSRAALANLASVPDASRLAALDAVLTVWPARAFALAAKIVSEMAL